MKGALPDAELTPRAVAGTGYHAPAAWPLRSALDRRCGTRSRLLSGVPTLARRAGAVSAVIGVTDRRRDRRDLRD